MGDYRAASSMIPGVSVGLGTGTYSNKGTILFAVAFDVWHSNLTYLVVERNSTDFS